MSIRETKIIREVDFKTRATNRGFDIVEFIDGYNHECSIEESSVAGEKWIWLGLEDPNPQIMCKDAVEMGVEPEKDCGWQKYDLPRQVNIWTKMHLNQEQVKAMLPYLINFAKKGEIILEENDQIMENGIQWKETERYDIGKNITEGLYCVEDGKENFRVVICSDKEGASHTFFVIDMNGRYINISLKYKNFDLDYVKNRCQMWIDNYSEEKAEDEEATIKKYREVVNIGDNVKHKFMYSSPVMFVVDTNYDEYFLDRKDNLVNCQWFDKNDELRNATFRMDFLIKIE